MAPEADRSLSKSIRKDYKKLLRSEQWQNYAETLSRQGLEWFFEFRIPELMSHVAPLLTVSDRVEPSLRLKIFFEMAAASTAVENLDRLFRECLREKDFEAAAATVGLAVTRIWDAGNDFRAFTVWRDRIGSLLEEASLTHLTRSFLYGNQAALAIIWRGDVRNSLAASEQGLMEAQKAVSRPLELYHMAGIAMSAYHSADITKMEFYLWEGRPLRDLNDMPAICTTLFNLGEALGMICRGRRADCFEMLRRIESHPHFNLMPASFWLFTKSQYVLAYMKYGDEANLLAATQVIQQKTVSDKNHFYHAVMHAYIGQAYLSRNPARAMLHCREALQRSALCCSEWTETMPLLLTAQVLSETNRMPDAEEILGQLIERFHSKGHFMYWILAMYEMAYLKVLVGRWHAAKGILSRILKLFPKGSVPLDHLALYRPPGFFEQLDLALPAPAVEVTAWADTESARIRVHTFGDLRLWIDGREITSHLWLGNRPKLLLKALIVHGGQNVPADLLADLLWPDADGDAATADLKVTLFRLRRVGLPRGESRMPWIVMLHRRLSLVPSSCYVDAVHFQHLVPGFDDESVCIERLKTAMGLYTDDFLIRDINEEWIYQHRARLKALFVIGAKILYDEVSKTGDIETALPYLELAAEKAPVDEGVYLRLMSGLLRINRRSSALKAFSMARDAFQAELGVEPGPQLIALAKEARIPDGG